MDLADDQVSIEVHLDAEWIQRALRSDVSVGLARTPKQLPPKWFYDDVGSDLFDQITRLDEYYPTRAEREILAREAHNIAQISGADTVIELGSGTSDKTLAVLDAFARTGALQKFVPFDVSEKTLVEAAQRIADRYPGLAVHAVVGDFEHHLDQLPKSSGRQLLALFGSTIGNFEPVARSKFFADVARQLNPGDSLLLGADLVKDHDRLVRAYDDSKGVTAAFNKNVLNVINRELGADFEPNRFEHVAKFNTYYERIEMWLRSSEDQLVTIPVLNMEVRFERGEEMLTEISAKFRPGGMRAELASAGFDQTEFWTDSAGDYGLIGGGATPSAIAAAATAGATAWTTLRSNTDGITLSGRR